MNVAAWRLLQRWHCIFLVRLIIGDMRVSIPENELLVLPAILHSLSKYDCIFQFPTPFSSFPITWKLGFHLKYFQRLSTTDRILHLLRDSVCESLRECTTTNDDCFALLKCDRFCVNFKRAMERTNACKCSKSKVSKDRYSFQFFKWTYLSWIQFVEF